MTASTQPPEHSAAELYDAHHSWLQEWLRRRLGCRHDAADLAHDTFVRLLAGRHTDPIREPRAFLTTLAQRTLFSFWRRRELERAYLDSLAGLPQASAPSEESRALVLEALMHIDRALQRLPLKARQAFLYSQLDELSYAEIAQRIGTSVITVRRYMKQAITLCVAARLSLPV
ncbi:MULTISPECIES: sigma-70 family RNA polymerase sigma factor [Achromobacter]|jgi:RNA polymerase sigma-70 factor (ECF subfamily)|uniref:Putative RNA polymerase sigma factor FecI n=1 Tax=Achromobacter kerstersii TaxID=1353890 RepID=A0A6S7AUG0_9BURK|nr:sigma-70 family RNA polymerase sigma factor [Achromobacter kerstersii]CAB3703757.1 putative RNA polymerase sigma factor FecI [Achromobacter kerstersii]